MAEDNAYDGSQYQFNPTPGPQQPQKYQQVGNRYRYYGELQGYTYNPYTDQYIPNKAGVTSVQEAAGYGPDKPKSAIETYTPLIGGAAALGLGTALGKNPGEVLGSAGDAIGKIGGYFGLGGGSAGATTAAASAAPTAGAAGTFGLGGLGSAGAAPAVEGVLSGTAAGGVPVGGAAATGATPGAFGLGGISGAGLAAAPLAAATAYYSATGVKDALKGKDLSFPQQAALALPTFGLSLAYNPIKGLFDKDEWKREKNSLNKLKDDGVFIPDNLLEGMPTKGRKLSSLVEKDLPPDFVGTTPDGRWVNNKFANSRNVADLQPTDIVNYSAFAEHDPQWFNKPMEERLALAEQALAANAVTEGKGTIKVDFSKLGTPTQAPSTPSQPVAPAQPKPVMKDPARPQVTNPVMPQQQAQAPQVQSPVAPKQGFGLRQSPGVYIDPKTGKPFNSVTGKLPGRR